MSARAGPVTIEYRNEDKGISHNLHVSGGGVDEKTDIAEGPTNQRLTVDLQPGTYRYACDVHPQQMRGELSVTG